MRLAAVLLGLLIVGGTFGCSQQSTSGGPSPTTSPTPVASSPAPSASSERAGPFCLVDLPTEWRDAFSRAAIPFPEGDRFVPAAVAPDGSLAFGDLFSTSWSGVVGVSPQGGITKISEFTDPANDQISGADFDGRWLVWSEVHSPSDWNDWDLKAWDSSTGQVKIITTTPRVDGRPVPGPFILPVTSNGYAAWVQASRSGQGEVHLHSLADDRDTVLGSGKATQPVAFWGSSVAWAETDVPGQSGHLVMANVPTGSPVDVPEPLASVKHWGSSFVGTSSLVAWDDAKSLWVWRPGERNAHQVFTAEIGDYVEFVAIAGDLVTWGGVKNQWAADLRSNSITKITQFGWRYAKNNALLLSQPIGPQKDTPSPQSMTAIVDATKLPPLPRCSA